MPDRALNPEQGRQQRRARMTTKASGAHDAVLPSHARVGVGRTRAPPKLAMGSAAHRISHFHLQVRLRVALDGGDHILHVEREAGVGVQQRRRHPARDIDAEVVVHLPDAVPVAHERFDHLDVRKVALRDAAAGARRLVRRAWRRITATVASGTARLRIDHG